MIRFFAAAMSIGIVHAAAAGSLTPLYSFQGGLDGASPRGAIVVDKAGNIFGTTDTGGATNDGTLFELSPPAGGTGPWTETILWNFVRDKGGSQPSGLVQDSHGNLFGMLGLGGPSNCGAAFELGKTATGWTRRILWHFSNTGDGCQPNFAPVIGAGGVLYATTFQGGANFEGTVVSLTPPPKGSTAWSEAVLYSFDYKDGEYPDSQPVLDAAGNLYAESSTGGKNGGGAVFELTPPQAGGTPWSYTALWSPDFYCQIGGGPLTFDAAGALYGNCPQSGAYHFGNIFKLTPPAAGQTAWTEQALFTFKSSGGNPPYGVSRDGQGDLFGVTVNQSGTLFELTPPKSGQTAWKKRVLWHFTGGSDGSKPDLPITLSAGKVITGTSGTGGLGYGTVWRWTP